VRLSPQTSRARPLLARCGRRTLPAPAAPSQSAPSRLTRPGRLPSQPCPRRPAAARGERGHGRGACQHVNHSRAVDRTGTARHGPARTTGAGCRCGCRHRAAGFGDPVACSSMSFPTALDLARLRRQLMAGAGCCYPRRPRSASLPASCWSHGWFRRPSSVLPDRCCCSPRCCACSPRTAWCDRHTPNTLAGRPPPRVAGGAVLAKQSQVRATASSWLGRPVARSRPSSGSPLRERPARNRCTGTCCRGHRPTPRTTNTPRLRTDPTNSALAVGDGCHHCLEGVVGAPPGRCRRGTCPASNRRRRPPAAAAAGLAAGALGLATLTSRRRTRTRLPLAVQAPSAELDERVRGHGLPTSGCPCVPGGTASSGLSGLLPVGRATQEVGPRPVRGRPGSDRLTLPARHRELPRLR